MNLFRNDPFSSHSSLEEDILIKNILLIHDPYGRHLDSEPLLRAVENVMCYTSVSEVSGFPIDGILDYDIRKIEIDQTEESLIEIISKISCEMLFRNSCERDLHSRTMIMFDLLGHYRWDAKVVLILAAFATSYGGFWLIMQLYPHNPLAVSVAKLKQLPNDLSMLKPMFKALSLLVKTMVDMAKCIVKFEGLPFRHIKLDDETMAITKHSVYISSYWITRSTLACSSQITDLICVKPEQVYLNSTTIAAWQLSTLVYKLSNIYSHLRQQVDLCHQQIEPKLYPKLLICFQERHPDNQEVLGMLIALKDELPLKNPYVHGKVGVSKLKNKVVVLLISKPELLPLHGLFLLLHQTYDHPDHKKLEENYDIVWLPISFSDVWTDAEAEEFTFLSNSLPCYSIRRPWSLHSITVNYIRQVWNFTGEPLMVVLDPQGMVTNSNALDMVLIWGAKAYPFSSSREMQLWEEETWSLRFLIDDIHPQLTRWVEEDRTICIYGSDNLDWIREFNAKMKKITSTGVRLELMYVGTRNLTELVSNILAIINEEMHSSLLTFAKLHFFWLRLESMQRSKLRTGSDHMRNEILSVLTSADEALVVIGRGSNSSDIIQLAGNKMIECLDNFSEWGGYIAKLGFLGALRTALERPQMPPQPEPCNHISILPYAEGLMERTVECNKCKRPMKMYILYE